MPGFRFLYNTSSRFGEKPNLVCDQICGHNFQLNRFTLNKFLDDKLFVEDEKGIIILEGVVLNKIDLIKSNNNLVWKDVVWNLYLKHGNEFFNVLRGSFSGLLYDKSKAKWIIFVDHLCTKPLYYYKHEQVFVMSGEIRDIYDYFKENALRAKLKVNSAYMLLSYGYMLENNTLCEDIQKILAGNYLVIQNNSFDFHQYYKLPESSFAKKIDEAETIECLDEKFKHAVALQFDKDREYNYKHFVSLSGGLDSRMVSWVAHEMGYSNQINFTFSQSNYLDETTPKRIASDLKHEWIFKALDNGLFLKDIEETNLITGGNSVYHGLAHSNSLYKLIDFSQLGIIHSGQLGDVVLGSYIGSFVKNYSKESLKNLSAAYSDRYVDRVQTKSVHFSGFPELEVSILYSRGLNGTNNGNLSEQSYTETISPFCDKDFFEFCLSIPIDSRSNHKIYKKWILKKHPKAADYIWEHAKRKISSKMIYFNIAGKKIPLDQIHASALRKLGLKKKPSETRFDMNPLDYWYSSNEDLKSFFDNYFAENIKGLDSFLELRDDCEVLYKSGSATEKVQVLTLLSAIKLYHLT